MSWISVGEKDIFRQRHKTPPSIALRPGLSTQQRNLPSSCAPCGRSTFEWRKQIELNPWGWRGQILKWKRNRHFAEKSEQFGSTSPFLLFAFLFLRGKKTHFAERKRTMESNFSFLLNCAASPDNLVHTWRVSGSNWVSVSWTTKKVSGSNFVNLFQIHKTG